MTVFLLHVEVGLGQSNFLKGKVLDAKTEDPIPFAAVFFNGTFNGTSTDSIGQFELEKSTDQPLPLVVSSLGYHTYTTKDYMDKTSIVIRLVPREYELDEIVVEDKSLVKQRKKFMKVFKRELLGTSNNARKCLIVNEEDLQFDYEAQGGDVRAFANKPLEIKNEALGYIIKYYLDEFHYENKYRVVTYVGHMVFEEDLTRSKSDQTKIEQRRENTYLGSAMHFFRSLWHNDLRDQDFEVFDVMNERLRHYDHIVQESGGVKSLVYSRNLLVCYKKKCRELQIRRPVVRFDEDGYHDPLGVLWLSGGREERLADTLPFEYRPSD